MKSSYRKAVFILAYIKNPVRYLVLKRKLHWQGWEFPKGGLRNKESMMLGVLRELKEETGQIPVVINKLNSSGRYNYEKKLADRPGITGQDFTLFSAQLKNKKIKLDKKEHSDYQWLNYKDALKILTWKNQKKCLRIVNSSL